MHRSVPILIAAALTFAACGGSDDNEPAAPATEAPATDPPATDPPATDPPATDPPATDPPATDPPATDPPTTDPPATEPPTTEPALPELPIVGNGPYPVGVQTIQIVDTTRDVPLTIDVWFPLAEGTEGPLHQYTLLPEVYYESPFAITADATAIAPDAPYPLVVYSHGSGGLRYIASYYTEAIASHGYVVAAPDHPGNTAVERITGAEVDSQAIALGRPNDISAVIDAMTNPESVETGGFVGSIDPERIAVTGHSFGGFTSYAMASGYDNENGTFDVDPRVDAIIPLAPATNGLTDERLAAIDVPALVMAGTNDVTTPIDPNVTRPWELSPSVPHRRVDLVDAAHQSFTDACDYLESVPSLPEVPDVIIETIEELAVEGCSPGDMPIERAKELTITFAVNFLDSMFRGAELYSPDNVVAPDDIVFLAK